MLFAIGLGIFGAIVGSCVDHTESGQRCNSYVRDTYNQARQYIER